MSALPCFDASAWEAPLDPCSDAALQAAAVATQSAPQADEATRDLLSDLLAAQGEAGRDQELLVGDFRWFGPGPGARSTPAMQVARARADWIDAACWLASGALLLGVVFTLNRFWGLWS